jgi:hypothetical protein
MKRLFIVGVLVSAVGAYAQGSGSQDTPKRARRAAAASGEQAGHAAPKPQPPTEPAPSVPEGEVKLGSVRIPKAVKANGQQLAAGTYQVTVTSQTASGQNAPGETPAKERWVEFSRGGKVAGKEVVIIVPQSEIGKVQKDAPPGSGGSKFETLKGGDYTRLWINRGGNHYLVYFPS